MTRLLAARLLKGTSFRAVRPLRATSFQTRLFTNTQQYDAIVLGAYTDGPKVALAASEGITSATRQTILDQLAVANFKKAGDVRVLYNVGGVKQVAVVSLGKSLPADQEAKAMESARTAAALGIQALHREAVERVGVDVSVDAHGAAEGAVLAQFSFDKLKNPKSQRKELFVGPFSTPAKTQSGLTWESGQVYGTSQNLARMLMTSPANLMTPKLFTEEVAYLLAGLENVEVTVHDEEWARRNNMNALLSVAKGSQEPLRFLEIHYKGGKENEAPFGLVGKGVTFDSGGISLKPSNNMALMKGDMGGAATVAGALYGISKMKLPVNVVAVTPLCENMPSGKATKPGDVIKAMNGKSIEVIDTDAEGRLILADALYYLSSKFGPKSVIDLATLTGAMDVALGNVFAGVFTNSDDLWKRLERAGEMTSDPFWRMPLDDGYLKEMKESLVADLNNLGKGRSGGACSAAAFLKEFVAGLDSPAEGEEPKETNDKNGEIAWAHIDIAGVMDSQSTHGYHIKGMSGRPTRSLIEYARSFNK
ncbi:cytosol aminopeptidase family, catalytic domain-containing protein [Radiomyces spectabilis]|uniref:cytosol aminopeptidase family, catalytic domain-containing protein n=1 Tax=Radiomyces spectabilis TaxID=64574 RepID=UPI00221F6CD6|nr:cytosol aminopeptidase family, catalytic domain-containing protein [Radiomyces spectabilis]KAI8390887.1 cytosol aminopeptidase family, catalytic domain-containing protein [Radiomyces spectabilis]